MSSKELLTEGRDEPGLFTLNPATQQFLQNLGWDGALPLIMALAPAVVKAVWGNPLPVEAGLFLGFSPPIAALIRTQVGWYQIAKRCGGQAPVLRQVAMAVAIILLLAFEVSVSVLTFDQVLPMKVWLIPAGFYAWYLVMISIALRRQYEPSTADAE
jgi:hypothetical protein